MNIYNYTKNGEFTGTTNTWRDPETPGRWVLPLLATFIKPPKTAKHEVAIFDGESWSIKPDFRGVQCWMKNDARPVLATEAGPLPEEVTTTAPPPFPVWDRDVWASDISQVSAAKWEEIQAERDRRLGCGFKVEVRSGEYKWYHSDQASRTQYLALVLAGASAPPLSWKTMDGSFEPMTPELVAKIFQAAMNLDWTVFTKAEEHKAAMEVSAKPDVYDFGHGWPEHFVAVKNAEKKPNLLRQAIDVTG